MKTVGVDRETCFFGFFCIFPSRYCSSPICSVTQFALSCGKEHWVLMIFEKVHTSFLLLLLLLKQKLKFLEYSDCFMKRNSSLSRFWKIKFFQWTPMEDHVSCNINLMKRQRQLDVLLRFFEFLRMKLWNCFLSPKDDIIFLSRVTLNIQGTLKRVSIESGAVCSQVPICHFSETG